MEIMNSRVWWTSAKVSLRYACQSSLLRCARRRHHGLLHSPLALLGLPAQHWCTYILLIPSYLWQQTLKERGWRQKLQYLRSWIRTWWCFALDEACSVVTLRMKTVKRDYFLSEQLYTVLYHAVPARYRPGLKDSKTKLCVHGNYTRL